MPASPHHQIPRELASSTQAATSKRHVLDFVGGGPHASLCRMIKKSGATSVLEVGVGDGTRAIAVLGTLGKLRPDRDIKYIAIDLFEMGDRPLTLKRFYQQMRSINVWPSLIPMPCQQGLTRVAHTFGAVDLVLLADPHVDTCDPMLARVTNPGSLVLQWDGQTWRQILRKSRDHREAA